MLFVPMVLILPMDWFAGWILAVMVHELGHLTALKIFKIRIHSICFGVFGARIITAAMSPVAEALCALAGPMAGLCMLRFAHVFPRAAVLGLVLSMYNLIPVYPLDGGRGIHSFLRIFLQQGRADVVTSWLSRIIIVLLAGVGIIVCVRYSFGVFAVLIPLVSIIAVARKNSLHCGKKDSTIHKRITARGIPYDIVIAKSFTPSTETGTVHRR
jgi:stage IV sporulation protein FB